jgi:hypothetical protein
MDLSFEKFFEGGEIGDDRKVQSPLVLFQVSNIFDEVPEMLVPVIFEDNKDNTVMWVVNLLLVFT